MISRKDLILPAGIAALLPRLHAHRRLLFFVLVATLLSAAAVSVIKKKSYQSCPVNLTEFGGNRPYLGPFDPVRQAPNEAAARPAAMRRRHSRYSRSTWPRATCGANAWPRERCGSSWHSDCS